MGRRAHQVWRSEHGETLARIGLPLCVYETAERWADFLENGHLHVHPDPGRFDAFRLPLPQQGELHRWLERHHETAPPFLLRALRERAAPGHVSPPTTAAEGLAWLASRGAVAWLVRHHELVLEAADVLCTELPRALPVRFDADRVRLGAALHDVGKLLHPEEMSAPGHAHEEAGEALLLGAGLPAEVARIAVTHARWDDPRAELEDRLVALADKLWKGKRDEALEAALTSELAARAKRPAWEVFAALDALTGRIAEDGPSRLRRSAV